MAGELDLERERMDTVEVKRGQDLYFRQAQEKSSEW